MPPNFIIWLIVSLLSIMLLFYAGAISVRQFLLRNMPIVSFAVIFSFFILFSAWLSNKPPDMHLLYSTAAKIIFMFNIILAGTAWLGRDGLLFLVKHVPSPRFKMFFILLWRSINGLRRNSAGIVNQIRSRLDLNGRDKYLIPKFYVRNLIMKDLYAFHHNQAAVVSRLGEGGDLSVWPVYIFKKKDIVLATVIISAIFINIILMRIFL